MPQMSLVLSETVSVGAFNPRIITPGWLLKNEVVREDKWLEDIIDSMPIDEDGFSLGGFQWDVDLERLIVSAKGTMRDCGQATALVFALLSHTPVSAVGHNFHYTCPVADWPQESIPKLGSRPITAFDNATETRWTGRFDREDVVIEVELLYPSEDEVIAVRTNFERRTGEDPASAKSAANMFVADRAAARDLAKSLFDLEVAP